ncbi:hypothetical protein ACVWWO_009399 [Bradyrhizobium sp. F1.13.1]
MTQQLHHGLDGMIIVARIGSMKFLPIMNGRVRRLPRKRRPRAACANIHAEMRRVGAWQVNWEKDCVGLQSRPNPVGADMNRFVHRLIMSMLLVAVLVLVWNVLGSR